MRYDRVKIGQVIRSERTSKGLTQIELAQSSGISLRSIQRIENGEVTARSYTLAILQQKLDFEFNETHLETNSETDITNKNFTRGNRRKKIIYSYICSVVIFIFSGLFLTMSASFPETNFELYTFIITTIAAHILAIQYIWKTN